MAVPRNVLRVRGPGAQKMIDDLRTLATKEILVGYPAETSQRTPEDGDEGAPEISNAAIAYINETGDPDLNIPARPHLGPAIAENEEEIAKRMGNMARAVLGNSAVTADQHMHRIGQFAADKVRKKITDGLAPPLKPSTLRARAARGSKGAKKELAARAEGQDPSTTHAKPLIDSGQLRQSIKYVIRNRSERGGNNA